MTLPFRRLATLVESTNARSDATLLSLASTGALTAREEFDGLGRQAPSNNTVERYWLTEPGNLVVNPMWLVGGGIGVSKLAGAVSPDYRVYRLAPEVHPPYIHHLLRSQPYRDQYKLYTRAETTFDRRVSKVDFNAMPVLVPSLDEQRRIADFLDAETVRIDILQHARDSQLATMAELALNRISAIVPSKSDVPFVRLGYLAAVQSGITVDGNRAFGANSVTLPYLRVANVQAGHVDLDSVSEITVPRFVARSATLKRGDVLMTEGGDIDKLGRGTVWLGEIEKCLHQNHVFAVRPDQRKVVPEYLAMITRTAYARSYFESTGTKTTNLASTSSSKIRDFRIPLFDTKEQARIFHDVDAWLKDVGRSEATLRQQLSLLAERRQALITAAVTGQIDVTTARGLSLSGGSAA
jgi:type I restriction enzyme S subunit